MPRQSANGAARPAHTRKLRSIPAIAEMYDVDRKTVRRWVASGLIHGYRIGGHLIKIDLDEVEAKIVKEVPAASTRP